VLFIRMFKSLLVASTTRVFNVRDKLAMFRIHILKLLYVSSVLTFRVLEFFPQCIGDGFHVVSVVFEMATCPFLGVAGYKQHVCVCERERECV